MCDPACISFGCKYLKPEEIRNKDILEVGSYNINGSLRTYLLENKPSKYIGVDIQAGPFVDQVCNAEDIITVFGKESFDVLVSTEMMEHVEKWKLIVSNFKNILRPNGSLIITTRSIGFAKHDHPFDFWRYEESDMRNIFSDFIIEATEKDIYAPGIFIKAKKPVNFIENNLTEYKLYNVSTGQR